MAKVLNYLHLHELEALSKAKLGLESWLEEIRRQRLVQVRSYLSKLKSFYSYDDDFESEEAYLLWKSASRGHVDAIVMLLQNGAHVDRGTKYGQTPLFDACAYGHLKAAQVLVDYGKADVKAKMWKGQTVLNVACEFGHLDTIRWAIEKGVDVNERDEFGKSAVWVAASFGYPKVVEMLIEFGADVNVADIEIGHTPLERTVSFAHVDVMEILLKNGAECDIKNLLMAAQSDHVEAATLLLKHVDVNASSEDGGNTALGFASCHGNAKMVQCLIAHGADVNMRGHTYPLTAATLHGHADVMQVLLEHGANVEQVDENGFRPLHVAVIDENLESVKVLVEQGQADINAYENPLENFESSCTPLCIASIYGNLDIVRYLIAQEADLSLSEKPSGTSPLALAIKKGHTNVAKFLLGNGADVEQEDKRGYRPLHIAASAGLLEAIKVLVDQGKADLNAKTNENKSAAELAFELNFSDCFEYLTLCKNELRIKFTSA